MNQKFSLICFAAITILSSCQSGPQPIRFGDDSCAFCKMTITEKKFGGEVVTRKGKVYKFDDIHCITSFLSGKTISKEEMEKIFLVDFSLKKQFVEAPNSFLFRSEGLLSPMGGNIAAFPDEESMNSFREKFNGTIVKWEDIYK